MPTPVPDPDQVETFGKRQRIGLWLGPVCLLLVLVLPTPAGMAPAAWHTVGVALLMAVWWMAESVPIPATALLPLVLFPLLGIADIRATATPYANPLIFLFLGGFLIAMAMQRWGLHRRIALRVIQRVGTGPRALVAGFMLASALLSMWVSNTATALMMLPIGLSVVQLVETQGEGRVGSNFTVALLLGIAYGCNIGGMGTLIGTPPNALLAGFMEEQYGYSISFVKWLVVGLPLVGIGLPLVFLVLTRVVFPIRITTLPGGRALIEEAVARLGAMSKPERWVAVVFFCTALLWIFRPLLSTYLPGLSDAGIAMLGGLILFVIPVKLREGVFVHDWATARQLPWGTLILFGGGLSLAGAFTETDLSTWIGEAMAGLDVLPMVLMLLVVVTVVVFLTELTSNAATTAAFLPVLAALAVGIGQNPLLLVVPAVFGASCAFMLPVATPPNAIVYGSERITVPQMSRAGLYLNVLFILLITVWAYTLIQWVFGIVPGVVPVWAQ